MGASRAAGLTIVVAIVLSVVAFGGSIDGAFVFDDTKQIAANPLIQDPRNLAVSLTSDVWAFEGSADAPSSPYWRPVFIAWLTGGWALFGARPAGWHVANLVLHCLASSLAYFAIRRVGASQPAAATTAWLFAVHPVHVESVAWVSGSPDLLAAVFLFGSFVAHRIYRSHRRSRAWEIASLVLFALALLSKEVALVLPAILLVADRVLEREPRPAWTRTLGAIAPFVAVAGAYIAARAAILGTAFATVPGAPDRASALLSAPAVVLFYLRQIVWPVALGPSYAFAPVTPATVGLARFVLPAAAIALLAAGSIALARRRPVFAVALAWLVLPLLPALALWRFLPEDLLHDRYLYLPLFGAAAIAAEAIALGWARAARAPALAGMGMAWAIGLPLAVACVPVTRAYVPTWHDEIALWQRAVRTNPEAAYPLAQLGETYRRAGRLPEARAQLEKALARSPSLKTAHSALGALAAGEGKLEEAETHLRLVLDSRPNDRAALEQLALVSQKQGKLDEAIELFERGRRNLPARWASYTVNLAVLHRLAGRVDESESLLRSLGDRLATSKDPAVVRAWWLLGELDRERGRTERAIASYEAYLTATSGMDGDPAVRRLREAAGGKIQELRRTR